ncbi:hypothetical protein, partial [Vibrio lentus]|uniref:hypothetical protein n=1 Tax=Vibrio lentus TaxID=136468 RepID=UPI003BB01C06
MSIKQTIALMSLLMSISFNALSGIKISSGVNAGEVYSSTAAYIEVMTNNCLSFSSYREAPYKFFTSGTANSTKFSFHGSTYTDSSCTKVYTARYLMTKNFTKEECAPPAQFNEAGLCEEPSCDDVKGESLGTITFPAGTRDVAAICRNSCRANSSLFFPAANPPYGVFTYTGDSCDGSETSEGGDGSTG